MFVAYKHLSKLLRYKQAAHVERQHGSTLLLIITVSASKSSLVTYKNARSALVASAADRFWITLPSSSTFEVKWKTFTTINDNSDFDLGGAIAHIFVGFKCARFH